MMIRSKNKGARIKMKLVLMFFFSLLPFCLSLSIFFAVDAGPRGSNGLWILATVRGPLIQERMFRENVSSSYTRTRGEAASYSLIARFSLARANNSSRDPPRGCNSTLSFSSLLFNCFLLLNFVLNVYTCIRTHGWDYNSHADFNSRVIKNNNDRYNGARRVSFAKESSIILECIKNKNCLSEAKTKGHETVKNYWKFRPRLKILWKIEIK